MNTRRVVATTMAGAGAAVMVSGMSLTFAKVGVGQSVPTTTTTTTVAAAPEQPAAFLAQLAAAIRTGNITFLLARLNPVVTNQFGDSTCRAHLQKLVDPTAAFVVDSVSAPTNYSYEAANKTTIVADVVPVQVMFTVNGVAQAATVHLGRLASGQLSWFTDCSAAP